VKIKPINPVVKTLAYAIRASSQRKAHVKIKPINPVVKTLAYAPKHGGRHTPKEFKRSTKQAVQLHLSCEAVQYLKERENDK